MGLWRTGNHASQITMYTILHRESPVNHATSINKGVVKMKCLAGGMKHLPHIRIIRNVILPGEPGRVRCHRKIKQQGMSGQEHRKVLLFRKFGSGRHTV